MEKRRRNARSMTWVILDSETVVKCVNCDKRGVNGYEEPCFICTRVGLLRGTEKP